MLVVGIDPGTQKTGVAWASDSKGRLTGGAQTAKSVIEWPHRYAHMLDQVKAIFEWLPEEPYAVAIEEPSVDGKDVYDASTRASFCHLHGMFAALSSEALRTCRKVIFLPWKTAEWRGVGPDKKIILGKMSAKYGIQLDTDDEGDALGIADHALMLLKQRRSREAAVHLAGAAEFRKLA